MNGLLLINKEAGYSSAHITRVARRITGQKKIGHTGTLDVLATGLLVLGLGSCTKIIEYLQEEEKEYICQMRFQIQKDTIDEEGIVIASTDKMVERADLEKSLKKFIGKICQVPPMYSAIKHKGKRLYDYAREGKIIERKSRQVDIDQIELLEFSYSDQKATIRVRCSAGTYIRSLVEDIAADLDNLAYMTYLQRTKCSGYRLEDALILDDSTSKSLLESSMISVDNIMQNKGQIEVNKDQARKLKNGMTIVLENFYKEDIYVIKEDNKTIGVCELKNSKKGSLVKLSKHLYQ